ncbi:MAG: asparagine synthase (glutamine-hydrolyzing) [Pseudomonadota bacterium]|nr:asparagine synthase (glutamine-hydrolyzing) [Pseudomonadota bacterium]
MCGIAGIYSPGPVDDPGRIPNLIRSVTAALDHRGPDDRAHWADPYCGIALGHTRLSIIDLSSAGAQPMQSQCGRYVIVYNGEVYNFADLRRKLESSGRVFRGHSDTEVLLEAIARWGFEEALRAVDGMFALAVWDRAERRLLLARDRIGEKPLYYGWHERQFIFASELKAFARIPGFKPALDRNALALYLRHNYIPEPHCVFEGFRKLTPGTWLALENAVPHELPEPRSYWTLKDVAAAGLAQAGELSDGQAVDRLEQLLVRAVQSRMVADVPLGAFLSGGIDSSTVVALMQSLSTQAVKTFSIGFDIDGYDEAPHARAVAQHLGTDHTELYVDAAEAREVIPQIPAIYDEPFADSSQIPMTLVSRLARRQVTVAMSGDAGDELFAGYLRYTLAVNLWRRVHHVPLALRGAAASFLHRISPRTWDGLLRPLYPLLPPRMRHATPGDKLHKLARLLPLQRPMDLYLRLISLWSEPDEIIIGAREPPSNFDGPHGGADIGAFVHRMMYLDTTHYLPGDILAKVDRAAMSVSLETRVPFLDPEVIAFAWQLPLKMKLRAGDGKWVLRRVLERYVPKHLFERPKMGFGVPIDTWLRGPLRPWAEDLLNEDRLRSAGYMRPEPIRNAWRAHLGGAENLQYHLWGVLVFEAWRDAWGY